MYLYYISYINFETSLIVLTYILQGLHVEKLTNERVPVDYKGKMKPDEKYPENYKTCINFFQLLPKMLHNMIKRRGG